MEELLEKKREKLQEIEKLGKNANYIQELSEIALIQLELENYEDSKKNLLTCLKYFKQSRERLGQAAVLGVLGALFFKKSEYEESIEAYEKALGVYKELTQVQEMIMCLKCIGNSYIKLNLLNEASEKFMDCCAICSDNNDIYNLLECIENLIFIYETHKNWDVVFELYKKTLKVFKEIKNNRGIITSYFNLGLLKKKSNNFIEALRYFKKGTNVAIDSNYAEHVIRGLGYVGESLFYQGEIKEAKNEFIKALNVAKNNGAKNAIIQLNILLKSLGLSEAEIDKE